MKTWVSLLVMVCGVAGAGEGVLLREDFNDLARWKPLTFPKITKHSVYAVAGDGSNSVLVATSKGSASGLVWRDTFEIRKYPLMRWRWKVDNVYKKGNAAVKAGDDYPIRVYVFFLYDPAKAGMGLRAKYGLAKRLYGEYPPYSSLNYIWANRAHDTDRIVSPYTNRAVMLVRRMGPRDIGRWVEESVDVFADYRRAFGEDPPAQASLAIMNDSDNTGEASVSYLDFIEVRERGTQR